MSALMVGAYLVSVGYTLWRAWFGPTREADRLDLLTVVGYALALAVALWVRTDDRRAWWAATILLGLQFVYAVVAYYPLTVATRSLDVLDGIEGTVFVALLAAAFVLAVQRLQDLRGQSRG